jgi:hypothetical protein
LNQYVDDVLDPYDCDTTLVELFDDLDEFARFGIGQTAANFVEQQDLGVGRQRTRKLKALTIEQGERFGLSIGETKHSTKL